MPYNSEIIRKATAALERQRALRQSRRDALQAELYDRAPELARLDAALRQGMVSVAMAALTPGGDAEGQVARLREENRILQARRTALLETLGQEADCLEDRPACPRCRDRGWIGSAMCPCLQELCAAEQLKHLSSMLDLGEQSFETFSLDWYDTDYDDTLGMTPREHMLLVGRTCRNYAQKFGKYMVHNLFLTGAPGLGKTFLSACIARVVSEAGYSVVYDTAVSVFSAFENAKFSREEVAAAAVERYLNCDLLILDDLGSELTSPMSQSALYTLINTRLTADRHTVISSNLSLADIHSRYQPMIASRLEGEYRELYFVGRDIRLQRKLGD